MHWQCNPFVHASANTFYSTSSCMHKEVHLKKPQWPNIHHHKWQVSKTWIYVKTIQKSQIHQSRYSDLLATKPTIHRIQTIVTWYRIHFETLFPFSTNLHNTSSADKFSNVRFSSILQVLWPQHSRVSHNFHTKIIYTTFNILFHPD